MIVASQTQLGRAEPSGSTTLQEMTKRWSKRTEICVWRRLYVPFFKLHILTQESMLLFIFGVKYPHYIFPLNY